jgi:hypothetical protein
MAGLHVREHHAGSDVTTGPPAVPQPRPASLVDLLDRVLATGVVVQGELTLSIADIDLVRISLQALLASIRPALDRPGEQA